MVRMFKKDRVSIVTPVYNGAAYLPHMLDSVLGQSYSEIEMILVDDGSADHTVRVAESYRERFVERGYEYRIVQAEHTCAAGAINKGLPFVTGEYLAWPDADDRLEQDSVAKRVGYLQKHPEYQCVRTLSYYYEENTGKPARPDENMEDCSNEELFWDILECRTFVCCGCYMLRTEPFFKIYPRRRIPEYHVGQNFQMLLPFMYRHRCPTIPEKLYGVCIREGSHSRTKLTREEEEERYGEYEELIDEIADICGIDDRESKDRLTYWKLRRRYMFAVKHRNKSSLLSSFRELHRLHLHGRMGIFRMAKDFAWACLEDTWAINSLYPAYRECANRCAQTVRQLAGKNKSQNKKKGR